MKILLLDVLRVNGEKISQILLMWECESQSSMFYVLCSAFYFF